MTIYSGIFNSVNGDRKYNAWWFAKYFATFIGNGVFPNPSLNLQVAAYQNMKIVVKPGSGWIDGYFIYSDGDHVLSLDVADGVLKRIDRVVMRLNHLTRKIEIVVKKGTFTSSPVAPTLQRDTDAYELALADVLINNGATQITQANITDQRLNSTVCGIVHGTVNQVDTTTIFNQYQAWFNDIKGSVAGELDVWQAAQEQEFLTWFESIKDILDGDVAANLAARVAKLEQIVNPHITDLVKHNNYGTATGTNTLAVTLTPALTTLTEGFTLRFKNTTANTGATTLNVNGLGAKPLRKNGGIALSAGNLKAGGIYSVTYDGASFLLADEGGEYGNAVEGDVRKGKTIGTAGGVKTGTLDLTNVKPENIRQGIIIDGVTGNLGIIGAGENQILPWEWTTMPRVTSESKPYWLLSDYGAKIEKSGKYRVKWRMSKLGSPSGGVPLTVYARLYLNDQPIPGTDRQITSDTTTSDQNYTLDIDLKTGDILRCGGMTPSDSRPTLYVYIDGLFTDLKTTPVKME
ncbi:hypothetical protein [Lysinibacillus sphaericus]|uniref:hypothetical protein n=1 Tax=Lysinibacillus sphaericus TaxID=1421 RepID=UPI00248BF84F|nr:hypothetical protein [Lysinibacillus sphaericus]